ncbi:MAG: hypothetical protein ACRD28_08160 [Acidobacteriaceae bacterium]
MNLLGIAVSDDKEADEQQQQHQNLQFPFRVAMQAHKEECKSVRNKNQERLRGPRSPSLTYKHRQKDGSRQTDQGQRLRTFEKKRFHQGRHRN